MKKKKKRTNTNAPSQHHCGIHGTLQEHISGKGDKNKSCRGGGVYKYHGNEHIAVAGTLGAKKMLFSFFLDKKQILTHTYGREIDCYRVEMYGMMNSSFCFLFTFFFASLNINFQHLVTQYFSL